MTKLILLEILNTLTCVYSANFRFITKSKDAVSRFLLKKKEKRIR